MSKQAKLQHWPWFCERRGDRSILRSSPDPNNPLHVMEGVKIVDEVQCSTMEPWKFQHYSIRSMHLVLLISYKRLR